MANRGINGIPYFDMEKYLDMETFEKLQPEIIHGFATAREYAKEGTWMAPGFTFEDMSYTLNWKPIYQALEEFQLLADEDPIKIEGMKLMPSDFGDYKQRNIFTRYLKMALGAYDPYIYYFLWEEGSWDDRTAERKLTEEAQYFPETVKWTEQLIKDNIFEHIGRVIFFHCEADGVPFEHRDLDAKNGMNQSFPHNNEFIHIRPNTKKAFYLWDPETKNKTYLNTRAAWWNDQDWHGGERIMEQSYALRIDGKFTEEFREKLGIFGIESY
ncbi:hypothetical protein N9C48_00450 [bacterium]|nr:hypothetical protein [bacterium]MDA9938560.1 hypothetical protein [bacterium]